MAVWLVGWDLVESNGPVTVSTNLLTPAKPTAFPDSKYDQYQSSYVYLSLIPQEDVCRMHVKGSHRMNNHSWQRWGSGAVIPVVLLSDLAKELEETDETKALLGHRSQDPVSNMMAETLSPKEGNDTGVGKSSIVCRFVQDHFDHNISPTIGASFMTKTVPCGNELHKFLIWDTAGQERDSFHTLKKWVKELKEHGPENIVMAIAGNKCDLSDIREVPMKDAKEYAESIGAIVVETSAKNAVNIEELFQGISRQIPPLDPHENGNNGAIKLGKQTSQTGRRCC
ncbi:ras-related protein Rab-31 [Antrostomus carolinensis]|uniref:ras-related protein Rab-31 n=1 Tax=Antrostomus carolinensis TaxID=279965 RepID=UPI0010A98B6E|nr:ras-related protein Rab-31 [Antrostomus carolinensis]